MVDLDGLEETDPQQLKMAEQYYKKTKLKQSEVFPNISPGLINSQVKSRFRSLGNLINQGEFFLCGPAAACHITASHDPQAYVKTVFDLYLNGFANGKAIKGSKSIFEAKPDANGNIDGIAAVDWILMHSLRQSENLLGGYDPHIKDDWSKMTFKSEFHDLVERMGANVSFSKSNASISSQDDITKLSSWIRDGKRAVMFINSYVYRDRGNITGIDGWVSEIYGRHFIVLKGLNLGEDGSINVSYWDRGNPELKDKCFDSFEDFQNSSFNYWLIKNDGQNKE
jgi:hypothetical protein